MARVERFCASMPPQKEVDCESVARAHNAIMDRLHKADPARRDPKLGYLSPQLMESVERTLFENPLPEIKRK
jgi:hypothetical protein